MDPERIGVRITVARGLRGEEVRTGFAEDPEPGDESITFEGMRLFVPSDIVARGATVDVADEHDRIVLR